jgi:BirA family biotin operon repressor/biotin-[acetyl-CoA-carboxylase] ligase
VETSASRIRLAAERIEALITLADVAWPTPVILDEVDSTNRVLAERPDAPEGTSVIAELQTSGRGRLGRQWESPWGSGVWMSVLVHPTDQARSDWAALPLIAALAVRDALESACDLRVGLKWPNDLVVNADEVRKLGGILVEVVGPDSVVIGMGTNMSLSREELPTPTATSVLLEGGNADREAFIASALQALSLRMAQWRADGFPRAAYLEACLTVGRPVRVDLPDGSVLEGLATGITDDGQLIVTRERELNETREREQVIVAAGDVIHATI